MDPNFTQRTLKSCHGTFSLHPELFVFCVFVRCFRDGEQSRSDCDLWWSRRLFSPLPLLIPLCVRDCVGGHAHGRCFHLVLLQSPNTPTSDLGMCLVWLHTHTHTHTQTHTHTHTHTQSLYSTLQPCSVSCYKVILIYLALTVHWQGLLIYCL